MTDHASPDHQKSLTLAAGVTYSYIHVPARSARPTLLLLHGFPETSYDWHVQIAHFRRAGYGLLVPDLLGYGHTSSPTDTAAYRLKGMCEHVVGIAAHEGVRGALVGVGHDWGSMLLSRLAAYFPDCFLAYAFVSVGFSPPQGRVDPVAMNAMIEPVLGYAAFGYFQFFAEQDAALLLDRNAESTDSLLFSDREGHWARNVCPPGAARAWLEQGRVEALPAWLDKTTIDTRRAIFQRAGGFSGPLNWYRQAQTDVNDADEAALPPERRGIPDQPVLLIADTGREAAVPGEFQKKMTADACKNLRIVEIDSCHWMMLQKPDEVNRALEGFLKEIAPRTG